MSESFALITGRTPEQGKALHQGKGSEAYWSTMSLVEMNLQDMARFSAMPQKSLGRPLRFRKASEVLQLSLQGNRQIPILGVVLLFSERFPSRRIGT